ncbi:MAG: hypothetical protein HY912_15155 [Desulfomonile tiedjei]|uniref:RepB-like DNA primase domain-containing protein n=1 Tax=Desulfomonile tiedjei TaxID=2358 RepID=A0A9D6V546_9BACT|nr:hypothetical protein [Desulfomonile tiedjei]
MIAKFTRKDFLEALFSPYYKEHRGFILVKSVKRGDPKMSTRYFPNIEILAKEHYGEERDVYFGICPRERMKAEKEHIHYLVALWADLDIGSEGHEDKRVFYEGPQQAAKAIRSFPRAPSIIVESGRGAHLYWLLKQVTEVTDIEKIEKILRTISDHLQCDTDVSLDTVLRLPETVNTKVPGKPVNCDVKFINPNFRYTLQDFENLGQRVVVPPSPRPAPKPASAPPGFSEERSQDPRSQGGAPLAGQSLEDSLVLDETIIDELIDDISMTGSVVADGPLPPGPDEDYEPEIESDVVTSVESPPVTTTMGRVTSTSVATTSSILEKLSSTKTEVEISLIGSETLINGVLMWNENGLIGVEAGSDLYTIPLSSVSFIKSRA